MDQIYSLKEIVDSMPCGYGEALGKYPFISNVAKVSNISADGLLKNDYEKRSFREDELKKLLVEKGDLLVVKSSGSKSNILSGKTAFCTELEEGQLIASNFLLRLKPKKNLVIPRYLWYILNSQRSKNYVKTIVGATTYPNLKWPLYGEHPVHLPSLYNQTRIAKILDNADNIRRKNRQILEKYNELEQSLFNEMFGDSITNSKGWQLISLAEVCQKITDGTHQPPKFVDSGIPFLFVSNIINYEINYDTIKFITENDFLELTKSTPIEIGDILYTTVGSYGNPAIIKLEIKFCFQRHIAHIKPKADLINIYFLHAMLKSPLVKRQADQLARGVAQKTLNLRELKSIQIFYPPTHLQNSFAEIVDYINKQKIITQKSLEKSENLFQSLLQRAFKGEL